MILLVYECQTHLTYFWADPLGDTERKIRMSITISSIGGILLAYPTELPKEQIEAAQLGALLGWASAIKKDPQTFGELMSQVITVLSQIGWTLSQSDHLTTKTTSAQLSSDIWSYISVHSTIIAELQRLVGNTRLFDSVGDFWWKHSFQAEGEAGIGIAYVQDANDNTIFDMYGFSLPSAGWQRLLTTPSSEEIMLNIMSTSFILNSQVWEQVKTTISEKSEKVQNLMSATVTSVT